MKHILFPTFEKVNLISLLFFKPSYNGTVLQRSIQEINPYTVTKQPNEEETVTKYYSVVWCKMSKKKHKKWDGDGIIAVRGRSLSLKDLEGKEIAKGSGYKTAELQILQEGHTLCAGGKELEIMGSISSEDYLSGKCFQSTASVSSSIVAPLTAVSKSFVNPAKHKSSKTGPTKSAALSRMTPRHSIDAPNALALPRPSASHQLANNKSVQPLVDVVVDPHLGQHLRPHQRDGVLFLYECVMGLRNFNGNGAILADEMGLGKTLQCIALIWTLHKQGPYGGQPVCNRILIITPGSLVKNWCAEFRKWLGNERMRVFPVTSDMRVKEFIISPIYPVLIISYEMFIRSQDDIMNIKFDLFICDEAHRLKNSAIKTTTLISGLKTRRRVLLTGTPIQNDLKEFHTLIELCNPGVLGTLFRRVYEQPIVNGQQPGATSEDKLLGQTRASELNRLTRLFFLRRTSEINEKYLPPKVEMVVFCRPAHLQVTLYRHLLTSRFLRGCLRASCPSSTHLECIGALKKLCNHPTLLYSASQGANTLGDEDQVSLYDGLLKLFPECNDASELSIAQSGKLTVLNSMLEEIHCTGERVVLVSNYSQTLDILQKLCTVKKYRYLRLDGSTPTAKRQSLVERFNAKHCQDFVFLLSSKAGGVGLNLIGASRLILYDIDWNPANDLQAMARVWRDGQRRRVVIYRLLTTGTIEEKIYQRQTTKQGLSGAVADDRKQVKVDFSQEDVKDLFTLDELTVCSTHDLLQCQRCNRVQQAEKEPDPSCVQTMTRACQLGMPPTEKKMNVSIAELMKWQHFPSPLCLTELCDDAILRAEDHITFVFRNEVNEDGTSRP
ncbi:predicted protein [Nematostella vectensis]|uniref:DNA repair and recombination protein RAD54B n=1 Tax=Nematostella vectensis TaxID=45351 RepID=A7SAK4_NEMVE|nr:predicted protein [Nematostella vectensis]|eukprot:XP_001631356.1 predicted protein [Nematostella vectensis]